MQLELVTVSTLTAIVVIVAGVVFIAETLLRDDDVVSRLWSLAFLSGILTSLAYVVWALAPETWWAVAIGNSAFVASAGFMWLGCRAFNGRTLRIPGMIVAVLVIAADIGVLLEGPEGGAWAGAIVMFIGLTVLPGAAAVEALRAPLGRIRTTLGFAVVVGIQACYYASRTAVALLVGMDSPLFANWWGTISTSIVTIVLTIVAVVVASVLRAERAGVRGRQTLTTPRFSEEGLLDSQSLEQLMAGSLARAARGGELVCVVSVRIDDLGRVATAFGTSEADELRSAWRRALLDDAPAQSWIGEDGAGGLVVTTVVPDEAEASRTAARLRRSVHEALARLDGAVIPVIGVGTSLTTGTSESARDLILRAREDAASAARSEQGDLATG